MRHRLSLLTIAALAALLALGLTAPAGAQPVPAKGQSPTVDKIRDAGKLRAGVAIALPWLGQDPKTGQYFGAAHGHHRPHC